MNPPVAMHQEKQETKKKYQGVLERGHIIREGIISSRIPRKKTFFGVLRSYLNGDLRP
jgi:hypothetical protein